MILGATRKNGVTTFSDIVVLEDDKCTVLPNISFETCKPGVKIEPITLPYFPHDKKLCIVDCLIKYTEKCNKLVSDVSQLNITDGKPDKSSAKDTISRWIGMFSQWQVLTQLFLLPIVADQPLQARQSPLECQLKTL